MTNLPWRSIRAGLPHPEDSADPQGRTCAIELDERAVRHFAEKHVADRTEPWGELFSPDDVREPARAWREGVSDSDRRALLDRTADLLLREAELALKRPLAVLFEHRTDAQNRWDARWLLILPSGLQVFLLPRGNTARILSAYFPNGALHGAADRRWRRTARIRRQRLVRLDLTRNSCRPPDPGDVMNFEGKQLRRVRLVTYASWGVIESPQGPNWRKPPEEWSHDAPHEPSPRPAQRPLRPRRPRRDEEDIHE